MATPKTQTSTLHRQWREGVKSSPRHTRTGSYWWRIVLSTLALALLAGLAYLLLSPYWQSRTHIVVLRAEALQPLEGPVSPVAGAELGLLSPLEQAATYHSSSEFDRLLSSPDALENLSEKIRALKLRPRDVLIVYVAAHGVLDNQGEASLVCDNYSPDHSQGGLCPLNHLFHELKKTPAKTKLVILDAGQMDYEPTLGIVGSDFPAAVQHVLDASKDAGLWVLCSHNNQQKSHRSAALGGSVFGTLALKGLHGAADADGDLAVTVGELAHFTKQHVATWVQQSSTGGTLQKPQLMHHGELTKKTETPELLSVAHLPEELRKLDVRELIRLASTQEGGSRWGDSGGVSSRGLLQRTARQSTDEAQAPEPVADDPTLASNEVIAEGENASPDESDGNENSEQKAKSQVKDSRPRLAKLLDNAWRMRDAIAKSSAADSRPLARPVDTTPHLWREFQEELIAYEQLLGYEQPQTAKHFSGILSESLSHFWVTNKDKSRVLNDFLQLSGETKQSKSRPSRQDIEAAQLSSLALIEALAQAGSTDLPAQLTNVREQLDGLVSASREDFSTQLSEAVWPEEFSHLYELRLAQRLATTTQVDAALKQFAIEVRSQGERVVADSLGCSGWLTTTITEADQQRLAGEQALFDRLADGWQDRAIVQLTRAEASYREAERLCGELTQAIALRNELVFAAPYYVRAYHNSGGSADGLAPSYENLSRFLESLSAFDNLLEHPASGNADRVIALRKQLTSLQENGIALSSEKARELGGGPTKLTDVWKMRRVLATPLVPASVRRTILRAIDEREIAFARSVNLSTGSTTDTNASANLQSQTRQWDLELKLARLATWTNGGQDADEEMNKLEDHYQSRFNPDSEDPAKSKVASRNLPNALANFYKQLSTRIDAGLSPQVNSTHAEASTRQIRALRALRLLGAREAWRYRDVSSRELDLRRQLFAMLRWQQQRMQTAQHDAPDAQRGYLVGVTNHYRHEANRLFRAEGPHASTAPQIKIEIPGATSLAIQQQQPIEFSVTPQSSEASALWVILQYDPEQLEIETDETVYHQHRLPDDLLAATSPGRADETRLRPTLESAVSGTAYPLGIKVRALPGRAESAQVIVKVIGRAARAESNNELATDELSVRTVDVPVSYVRQSLKFPLRVLDLAVEGYPNTWKASAKHLRLYPFPNRTDEYRFGVVNRGTNARPNVSLQIFAPNRSVDLSTMNREQIADLLANSAPVQAYSLAVPADQKPHFPGEEEPSSEKPAEAVPQAAEPSPPEAEGEEAEEAPTGPLLHHGLLVEVFDADDPQQSFVRQISILPQRPRRYVQPQVSYNPTLERIEISVTPRLRSLLPATPVRVECEIAEEKLAATGGKLRAQLMAPDYRAQLFVYVPASPPQTVTLHLNVDDYPRAFVYHVPCGAHVAGLAEEANLAEVRIRKSPPGKHFQAPQEMTPVGLEIDAPIGTFEAGGDTIRLAIDENMDQRLGPERGHFFGSDRQVHCHLENLSGEGLLTLKTRVSDHTVGLSTDRLQNVSVRVHGRMSLEGGRFSAQPATLNIDGGPPKIHHVQVLPFGGLVPTGTPLMAHVTVSDSLSGVERVELTFDTEGLDEFGPAAQPIAAILDSETNSDDPYANLFDRNGKRLKREADRIDARPKRWTAQLSTEGLLGVQTLLVRAIDRVGNVSETYRSRVQLFTPEQAAAQIAEFSATLKGVITYRKGRVEGVEVTLVSAEGEALATSATSAQGEYSFPGIGVGEYLLHARGIIYNVPRCGTKTVVIDPAGSALVHADFSLNQKCQ